MPIETVNPATGTLEKQYEEFSPEQTVATVAAVARAWESWKETSFEERASCLKALAGLLRERAGDLAKVMAQDMGKPVTPGTGEVMKCAAVCDFYAENGAAMLARQPVEGCGRTSYVDYEPLGTVLAVMPWNFPFWQVVRIGAPTLMAGNTMVLKHASNVPQCALALDEVFNAAFPKDVFRSLLIGAGQVETVLDQDSVIGVSLTGSEGAGRRVAAAAGARLKKSVMELGGSDPLIVLADADIPQAAATAALSRCGNTGQTCIAAKRFIVAKEVYEEFLQALKTEMAKLKQGDPLDKDTVIGPMASARLRDDLQDQVDRCLAAGGRVACGGTVPDGPGFFYPPTIVTDVPPEADVCREELFGPVALVFKVEDADQALALANATPFGLGGSIWTGDEHKGLELARRIKAGTVFVNGLVRSDPNLPFGGIGCSGFGRELGSYGIRELVNVKSVCAG